MSNNANTNNKQQQYTSNNAYSNSSNTNQNQNNNQRNNKPNFANSKGTINNNTPLNPNAKVEKPENLKDVKTKVAGIFQKSNGENDNVKAPKKTYLEGSADLKYKEEVDVNIEKRVFQSNKNETNFVDINSNQDLFLKNLSNKNVEEELVYSTPKEDREKKPRDQNKKRTFNNNNNEKREKRNYENKEKEENTTQYDSDGFEIIQEKVKTKKPKRNFDGEKRRFKKDEDREERPQTAIRKNSNVSDKVMQKPKAVAVEKVAMEVNTASNLKDLLK